MGAEKTRAARHHGNRQARANGVFFGFRHVGVTALCRYSHPLTFSVASHFPFAHGSWLWLCDRGKAPWSDPAHLAPVPASTTGIVRHKIFKSSQSDQLSMYCKSNRTHSRKSFTLLRPLICHRPVTPGLTLKRR